MCGVQLTQRDEMFCLILGELRNNLRFRLCSKEWKQLS